MVHFWGTPPPRSIGIIELWEHVRQNLGAQQHSGKILIRKDLGPAGRYLLTLFFALAMICAFDFGRQGGGHSGL